MYHVTKTNYVEKENPGPQMSPGGYVWIVFESALVIVIDTFQWKQWQIAENFSLDAGAYIIDNTYGIVEFDNGCCSLLDLHIFAEEYALVKTLWRWVPASRSDSFSLVVG